MVRGEVYKKNLEALENQQCWTKGHWWERPEGEGGIAMKTTTIRKLLTIAVPQALQQEHLLKSEVDDLVECILNNSTLTVSPDDNIDLHEGNTFGIGDSNKDRELQLQKYYVFSFTKTRLVDFHSSWVHAVTMTRSWRLVSMPDFQRIESYIRQNYGNNTYIAVLVEAEPLEFTVVNDANTEADIWLSVCKEIKWDTPVFKLSYKLAGGVYEEKFNSRELFENRIVQLIAKDAECLRVFNIIDGNKHLGFKVAGDVYLSGGKPEISDRNTCILWDSSHFEDNNDGWEFEIEQYQIEHCQGLGKV